MTTSDAIGHGAVAYGSYVAAADGDGARGTPEPRARAERLAARHPDLDPSSASAEPPVTSAGACAGG